MFGMRAVNARRYKKTVYKVLKKRQSGLKTICPDKIFNYERIYWTFLSIVEPNRHSGQKYSLKKTFNKEIQLIR